jgi:hypothetical protein
VTWTGGAVRRQEPTASKIHVAGAERDCARARHGQLHAAAAGLAGTRMRWIGHGDERRPDGPATAARETGRHIRRATAQPTCHPRVRLQCTPTYPHAHIHTVCTTNQSTRATNHRHNDKSQHAPHLSVASVACFRTSSARAHDSQHRYGHQIHHIEHAARPPYPFPSRREQLAALRCPCVGGVASSSIAA